jgi:hypothetical protein
MSVGTITNDLTGMAGDPAARWIALAVGAGVLATALIRVIRRPAFAAFQSSVFESSFTSPVASRATPPAHPPAQGPRRRRP